MTDEELIKHNEEAKTKILTAALKLFARHGFDGVSVRDITSEAQVNLSLVSYHFGGKEGLYREVVVSGILKAKAMVEPILEKFDGPMKKDTFSSEIRQILNVVINFKLSSPEFHTIIMHEIVNGYPYLKDICDEMFDPIAKRIVGLFDEAQRKKIIRPDINTWVHFMSMVHATDMYFEMLRIKPEWASRSYHMPEEKDKYIEQVYAVFVEGIML